MKIASFVLFAGLGIVALACGGGTTEDVAGPGEVQDLTASTTCAPITVLRCKPGFELSEVGCEPSHVPGAAPQGKCVPVDLAKLVGTWENPQGKDDDLGFFTFTFNADGTYNAVGGCRPGPTGEHCFAIVTQSGTWTLTPSPSLSVASSVTLVENIAKQKTTLFYTLDGTNLTFSTATHGKQSIFEKQDTTSIQCLPSLQLSCLGGQHFTTDGCAQPLAPAGEHEPMGHCVQ